jgi:ankyrin repeat protein
MTKHLTADDPLALALTAAIHAGHVDELQDLLASQPGLASVRIVDAKGVGRTLLHLAADWPGHLPNAASAVTALIEAGADPNAVLGPQGEAAAAETPLHWAASNDDVATIDALLDGGADLEAPGAIFTGGTPMSDAVIFAQWNAARRLLARGARTTFWQSAALGLTDRVHADFAADTPPSTDDVTNAFWNACRGGHQETAEYLLARGADLNWIGHDHKTPLEMARESGVTPLVDWLVEHGARTAVDR